MAHPVCISKSSVPRHSGRTFGDNMKAKSTFFVAAALLLIGATTAALLLNPRQYYRFHAGRVYLVTNPQTLFNSLRPPPCLQFEVPCLARANSWKPSADQVRQAIAEENLQLSPQEIEDVVRSCVSYREWMANAEPNGAANRSQPVRSQTNRTSVAAGSGR